MDREQAEQADLRLAYVQHPIPAQGVTQTPTHLIVAEHATAEGTYVALTRAREQTDIHVSEEMLLDSEGSSRWSGSRTGGTHRAGGAFDRVAAAAANHGWER